MNLLGLIAAVTVGALGVRGDSTCPTPAEVQSRLEGLGASEGPMSWVELHTTRKTVELLLWNPERALLAVRVLERGGSCEQLSAAAAVVIATWVPLTERGALEPRMRPGPSVQQPITEPDGHRWRLQPGFTLGARAMSPFYALGATVDLAWVSDDAPGLIFEGSVVGPIFSPTAAGQVRLGGLQAPLGGASSSLGGWAGAGRAFSASLGGGPLYRLRLKSVALDGFLTASALLVTTGSANIAALDTDLGVRVLFGSKGVVPFVRASGGMALFGWNVPHFHLAVGVTWGGS